MDTSTFAQKIKAKYPAYQNVDDATLVTKFIEKYPVYKSQVQQEPTMGQNIVSDIKERGQNISDINTMRNQGQSVVGEVLSTVAPKLSERLGGLLKRGQQVKQFVSNPSNDLATTGQLAGGVNDVIGEVIGAIIPEKWKQFGGEKVKQLLGTAGIDTIEKYNDWATKNPLTAKNIEGAVNIAGLLPTGKAGEVVGTAAVGTLKSGGTKLVGAVDNTIKPIVSTIEDAGTSFIKRISDPDVSQATKVSLNPSEALKGTTQDIQVSIGGKLKNISEATPQEIEKLKIGNAKNVDNFTVQAEKFANDRGVAGGSPVEIVGQRTDRVLDIADKKRQTIGSKMGLIEEKFAGTIVPMKENTFKQFADIVDYSKNPKYGVSSQNAPVVQEFINNFDTLNASGLTVKERNDFIRNWSEYLRDAKDTFGNFKENATVNTKIQNAVNTLKTETVDAIPDKTYRKLRKQYAEYKKLDEIGNQLLGKDGALGERVKGAATVKRAIQSNSDAGARQFLIKLKQLTGYDAIKEGDLALTAMENVGDYQGLSLLNIIQDGKTGIINKALEKGQDILVGDKATRVKKYIRK